ncbi:DegT/DnrJ/EryC1/StrS aminotransferase family protein [Magnetospira sp. QH-2]|uniref:DegT/DnrJ/EryC1/StrS family aminotransferase n=1 Tax=Magnetospira sp. (strain QH-2) TaxID=1288970 RepID=UPI0003E80CE1|nr:DegT/DnrJ/EryC1/StrS family aminotransferase [Magnetospira sp. QH-2]CCQ75489.1 putative DegT/DnrJ/EryC1/StrS aminotransferase family protein [Magnetospira sp. QH-2]
MSDPRPEVPSPLPFVDLAAQFRGMEDELMEAMREVCQSAAFIRGPAVETFERAFAEAHGGGHAVGLASGTDALALAVRVLDIGAGDEVVTVPNTWISTAFAVSYAGAKPVFVDIDPATGQMDAAKLEAVLTPKTKAVIPVHLFGHPAPMDAIMAICEPRGIAVIEDVAQAPLARLNGQTVGTFGALSCFSFYPSKNLGAYGDGGLVFTGDAALAERVRRLAFYGQEAAHHHVEIGFNSRLDTLQAAILLKKLPHLEDWNLRRREAAGQYDQALVKLSPHVVPLARAPGADPVFHLYVVKAARRDELLAHLRANGVLAQVHYPGVVHLQECYSHLGYRAGDFPEAEAAAGQILSLPIFPEITDAQITETARLIADFYGMACP